MDQADDGVAGGWVERCVDGGDADAFVGVDDEQDAGGFAVDLLKAGDAELFGDRCGFEDCAAGDLSLDEGEVDIVAEQLTASKVMMRVGLR